MARESDQAKLLPLYELDRIRPGPSARDPGPGQIKDPRTVARLRGELAIQLAAKDPTDARAEVTAISDPRLRAHFLVRLAAVLPESEAGSKASAARGGDRPGAGDARASHASSTCSSRLSKDCSISGRLNWRSRSFRKDSRSSIRDRPRAAPMPEGSWPRLRASTPRKRTRAFRNSPTRPSETISYRQAAVEMARSQPADAERFFGLIERAKRISDVRDDAPSLPPAGEVDLPRAQRIAAAIETPGARACAWAFTALGASSA